MQEFNVKVTGFITVEARNEKEAEKKVSWMETDFNDLEVESATTKPKKDLVAMLEKLKKDELNYYPIATVFANAPRALMQLKLSTKINLLEELLDLPISKFPLKK
jgi:hypothetical protein